MEQMEKNPELKSSTMADLETRLRRNLDREIFGFEVTEDKNQADQT